MPNSFFKFKQFTIRQDRCAMKVGTDGVCLAAWAVHFCSSVKPQYILDIGTGSGLISLMLAQKFPNSVIHGIEINSEAALQAHENFENAPFNNLTVQHCSLADFKPVHTFDLIISNPPFFKNTFRSDSAERNTARINDTLPLTQLLGFSKKYLSANGKLIFIYPSDNFNTSDVEHEGLHLRHLVKVYPTPGKGVKRVIAVCSEQPHPFTEESLIIEESRHHYSEKFKFLCQDYYLYL